MSDRLAARPPIISGLTYIRLLGSGGFADVYLYQQELPRRHVAVKVLRQKIMDPEVQRAFVRETNVTAQLGSHPSILTVFEAGLSADGRAYLISELCEPVPARNWRTDRLPLDRVLEIGVNMASALETVHRAGQLHRDIKPSNILTTAFGQAVLADFGVASVIEADPVNEEHAMSLPWSSPEVVSLSTTGTVSAEVWALGATLYSLIAGRSPFENVDGRFNSTDDLKKRITKAIIPPLGVAGVPQVVESVLFKAMAKTPEDRFASMQEFAMELNELQGSLGLRNTPLAFPISNSVNIPTIDSDDVAVLSGSVVAVESSRRKRKVSAPAYKRLDSEVVVSRVKRINPITLVLTLAAAAGFIVALIVIFSVGS